ncbi:carbonic anhydrase 1-like [Suncus etruscus]|uniref:carbonic anhydrase 1-like n=1 Tax=Suncus etruscus TaxID=109475 RepID=UPI00211031E0|nr:carbonic anhydrase 1-like [Suncus etruscus]
MANFNWGYGRENGPEQWSKIYPCANGNNQSPINIKTKDVKPDICLNPISICYDPAAAREMINIGYTVQVKFDDCDDLSVLTGGPGCKCYRLRELHFHWGSIDECGSEHAVDGVKYSGEIHIVHWDSEKYSNFSEAVSQPDGLVIIAVFMKVGQENPNLKRIVDTLKAVKTKGKKVPFTNFNPCCLLPSCMDYWTYCGSLTTPPLYESVTWIICKEPITISSNQLAQFRCLLSNAECEADVPIQTNCRPPQPLKGRVVRTFNLTDPEENSPSAKYAAMFVTQSNKVTFRKQ